EGYSKEETMTASAASIQEGRRVAARAGVRVELLTVLWMTLEALLAIGSGILARSVLLTAFGFDSVIELLSGGVLLWRLAVEAGDVADTRQERVEQVERRATWIAAGLLVGLCLYLVGTTGVGWLAHIEPEASL